MSTEELIIGDYRLVNCVATGSVSQVWEVSDAVSGRHLAMKLLLPEAFANSNEKRLLKQEYKIADTFDHPNIIRAEGYGQTKEHAYYLMEFFGVPNVKQLVRGSLQTVHTRFRRLAECTALALGHMHEKGWAHKDVKPDNILLSKGSEVRLIDFSLATKIPVGFGKVLGGKCKVIQGTRTYIPPEIIRKKPADPQSDIYSFGATLFECLTGRPPFMGDTPNDLLAKHIREKPPAPSDYHPNVSPEMDQLIARMMAKKPENRPQGIGELLTEIRKVQIFKEDPAEYEAALVVKAKAKATEDSLEGRLSSRADAERNQQKNGDRDKKPLRKKTASPPSQPKTSPKVEQPAVQPKSPRPENSPQKSPQSAPVTPPVNPDDLPFMDELPDII